VSSPSPNRLIHETSPYLRKHAHNPVDWYPWGPEALALSREQDKPIFLSIGYSACHWCHVMERECFEDPNIAALMNERFVNIKVDREERPDIDDIYMKAVTALTGSGGWPMSVFLTPQLQPFFGATYLPPVRAYGRPSFPDVLVGLSDAYLKEREAVVRQAHELTDAIVKDAAADARAPLPDNVLTLAVEHFRKRFDAHWGGFGKAPKFPHASDIRLCLRLHRHFGDAQVLLMATRTLDAMGSGGIHDQLAGGFHRYSTDREWRVPHFEKMLYDNAQLLPAYLEGYTLTKNPAYARVAHGICHWALHEMQLPEGGFSSSQDADSEGEEGRFFVWTKAQLQEVLGEPLAQLAAAYYDVTEVGNFEQGKNVLWVPRPLNEVASMLSITPEQLAEDIARAREKLSAARSQRIRPQTDDKVLTAWNGLMVSGLALAYQTLGEPRYLDAARSCIDFIFSALSTAEGKLYGTWRQGRAHVNAGLDDYAFVAAALCDVYESTFDVDYVRRALSLTEYVEQHFADPEHGGYFTTSDDHETLIARLKSTQDGALPAGAAVHTLNLLRLSALCSRRDLRERAEQSLESLGALAQRVPTAFAQLLIAFEFLRSDPCEVVIAGEPSDPQVQALLASVRSTFRPERVVALAHAGADASLIPLLNDKAPGPHGAQAFVCHNEHCHAPVSSPVELREELSAPHVRSR